MSLVFLKKRFDENEFHNPFDKNYKWTSTFNSPLELPANAQVAYISSTIPMAASPTIGDENDEFYIVIGNDELNMPYKINLPIGTFESFASMAQVLNQICNRDNQQVDWNTDTTTSVGGVITNVNGWTSTFDNTSFKIKLATLQRPTNSVKRAGYNVSYAPQFPSGLNTQNDLASYNIGSPDGSTQVANPAFQFQAGAALWNVGWMRLDNLGATTPLPGIAAPGEYPAAGMYSMATTETGIKRAGLSIGAPGRFNEILLQCHNLIEADAHQPPVPGNGLLECVMGLIPSCWVQSADDGISLPSFALETHLTNCQINGGTNANAMLQWVVGQNGLINIFVNDGTYSNPAMTLIDTFDPAALVPQPIAPPVRHITYRVLMENPYAVSLWVSSDYNETSNIGTWTLLYNMATGQTSTQPAAASRTRAIPSWFGDLVPVMYSGYISQFRLRGNFDNKRGYRPVLGEPNINEEQNLTEKALIKEPTMSIEPLTLATGMMEKDIYVCFNPISTTLALDRYKYPAIFQPGNAGYPVPYDGINAFSIGTPYTNFGEMLGFGNAEDTQLLLTTAGDYTSYEKEAGNALQNSRNINSIHIQLTNLPIQSKNATIQGDVKDIAVVPCYSNDTKAIDSLNNVNIFYHQANDKNWVDINNFQAMTLNSIETYLTYDNNKPADVVKDDAEVLVMFRQKPANEMGNGFIQTTSFNPYQSSTQSVST